MVKRLRYCEEQVSRLIGEAISLSVQRTTYIVASSAWRAAGNMRPRMTFQRYVLDLRLSAMHSWHGSADGSSRWLHIFGVDSEAWPLGLNKEMMYEISIPLVVTL